MTDDTDDSSRTQKDIINSRHFKKKLGSYYTPYNLARLIASESLNAWFDREKNLITHDSQRAKLSAGKESSQLLALMDNIRILDPSVGDGAFLLAAADRRKADKSW